jgi:hypothetical protein
MKTLTSLSALCIAGLLATAGFSGGPNNQASEPVDVLLQFSIQNARTPAAFGDLGLNVELCDEDRNVILRPTTFLESYWPDYSFERKMVLGRRHFLKVYGDNTLQRVVEFTPTSTTVKLDPIALVKGDMDQNGVIDEYDFEYVLRFADQKVSEKPRHFDEGIPVHVVAERLEQSGDRTTDCLGRHPKLADINGDGAISFSEALEVKRNIGKVDELFMFERPKGRHPGALLGLHPDGSDPHTIRRSGSGG